MPAFALRQIVILTGLLFMLAPATAHAATEPAGFLPFAPDSVWNLPIPSDAPLAANSAGYVSALTQSVAARGSWLNTTNCGMPEYWADADTPTVSVTLNHPSYADPALIRAWSAVPIPADAQPANCSDRNFAVLQRQPDGTIKEWEFWKASQGADGSWSAEWGGAINNVLTDRGIASPLEWTDPSAPTYSARRSTNGWNVTASSISMIAGVITNADLASGHIDHAIAMAIPTPAAGKWFWPAQRSDGSSTSADALPEGAHLRLSPSLNITSLHLDPLMQMIAEAAQKYGIIVRDATYSSNAFYAEQPLPGQISPVNALLDGQSTSAAMASFPWSELQVLAAPLCTSVSGCSVTPQAVIGVDGSLMPGSIVKLDTSGSALNYPRSQVQWDLNGSGDYTTAAGTAVSTTLPLTADGSRTVGVRITTADGTVVTGTVSFVVGSQTATGSSTSTLLTAVSPAGKQPAAATPTPSLTPAAPWAAPSAAPPRRSAAGDPTRIGEEHHADIDRAGRHPRADDQARPGTDEVRISEEAGAPLARPKRPRPALRRSAPLRPPSLTANARRHPDPHPGRGPGRCALPWPLRHQRGGRGAPGLSPVRARLHLESCRPGAGPSQLG